MEKDFRKKTFRGAKIEDLIVEFEKLAKFCEEKIKASEHMDSQRFYEGMSIAYTTVVLKLKGEFDYIETKVIDELYNAATKVDFKAELMEASTDYVEACSFCKREKAEVGTLVIGPGVSICESCLEFGKDVLKENEKNN